MQNSAVLHARMCLELDHFRAYVWHDIRAFQHNVAVAFLCVRSVFFRNKHRFCDLIHVINQITPV